MNFVKEIGTVVRCGGFPGRGAPQLQLEEVGDRCSLACLGVRGLDSGTGWPMDATHP